MAAARSAAVVWRLSAPDSRTASSHGAGVPRAMIVCVAEPPSELVPSA